MTLFTETEDREEKKRRVTEDFKSNKGCRMKGTFDIDRVPGNFHFSCHGYADVIQDFLNEGGYSKKMLIQDKLIKQLISHILFINYGLDRKKESIQIH